MTHNTLGFILLAMLSIGNVFANTSVKALTDSERNQLSNYLLFHLKSKATAGHDTTHD